MRTRLGLVILFLFAPALARGETLEAWAQGVSGELDRVEAQLVSVTDEVERGRSLREHGRLLRRFMSGSGHRLVHRDEAEKLGQRMVSDLEQSVEIFRTRVGGQPDADLAASLTELGRCFVGGLPGTVKNARMDPRRTSCLEEAVVMYRAIHGGPHLDMQGPLEGLIENDLASSRWEDLEKHLAAMEECWAGQPRTQIRGGWMAYWRARLSSRNSPGIPDEAIAGYKCALELLMPLYPKGHPRVDRVWRAGMLAHMAAPEGDSATKFKEIYELAGTHRTDGSVIMLGAGVYQGMLKAGRTAEAAEFATWLEERFQWKAGAD